MACRCTKCVYLTHQTLARERTDRRLVRYSQKNPHRPIRRSERLLFFDRGVFCKRLERRNNQTERVEGELKLRARRARLDLLMQAPQALTDFFGLQDRHRLFENGRFEVQEQWHCHRLEIANSIRRLHRRTGQDTCAPRLLQQFVSENRRKSFQFIDIIRTANERESQFPGLLKLAIINFQSLYRTKTRWQDVKDV